MKKLLLLLATGSIASMVALAQNSNSNGIGNAYGYVNAPNGTIAIPASSVEYPGSVGRRAHTNHLIFLRNTGRQQSYLSGLSPANVATAYSLSGLGGGGVIAIVDAYHYPGASSDLNTFSTKFGLPAMNACGNSYSKPCFSQVYADSSGNLTSKQPGVDCGWNQEAALDIEWAHAMAPDAAVVLVEAQSASYADLFGAVTAAANLVSGNGGGEVSMSWGGSEFSGETSYDSTFKPWSNLVFVGSSGDTGGQTIYPSTSPYVVAAGGTTLKMTATTVLSETGWSGSGGGPSKYEPIPDYQAGIQSIAGTKRGVPDFSFDADPSTGVYVYGPTCSGSNTGWMIFGGTSVSAPSLAGIINSAAQTSGQATTAGELGRIYSLIPAEYRDIVSGRAGRYKNLPGWDFVTGIGTPITLGGK